MLARPVPAVPGARPSPDTPPPAPPELPHHYHTTAAGFTPVVVDPKFRGTCSLQQGDRQKCDDGMGLSDGTTPEDYRLMYDPDEVEGCGLVALSKAVQESTVSGLGSWAAELGFRAGHAHEPPSGRAPCATPSRACHARAGMAAARPAHAPADESACFCATSKRARPGGVYCRREQPAQRQLLAWAAVTPVAATSLHRSSSMLSRGRSGATAASRPSPLSASVWGRGVPRDVSVPERAWPAPPRNLGCLQQPQPRLLPGGSAMSCGATFLG